MLVRYELPCSIEENGVNISSASLMCCVSISSEITNMFSSLGWLDYLRTSLVSVNKCVGWAQPATMAVSPLHNRLNIPGVSALHC